MKENDIALDGKRLLMEIRNVPDEIGVYPQAALGGDYPYEKRTDFMQGWNACVCNYGHETAPFSPCQAPPTFRLTELPIAQIISPRTNPQ